MTIRDTEPQPAATADRVLVFDTTLRDGEQSPGAAMTLAQKLEIAQTLAALGVDVIEAGFPSSVPAEVEAVRAIARATSGPIVCALARCLRGDIDLAWQALRDAPRPRLHVFIATSPIHRQYKLRKSCGQVVALAAEGVSRAREVCDDVEFSAEDASRTEPEFLAEVFQRAIEAGATTLNVPDTVGYATPADTAETIVRLRRDVPGIERVTLSVHCHDDLGLAVANTLAAVAAGARQVECTINGIGERAGNCSLEEVVMALKTRADRFGVSTGIDTRGLCAASELVSRITGFAVPPNKAVVGRNAFAHEAGIHQHGVLARQDTYEVMSAEDVGADSRLVLGKHSGRHALRSRFAGLGCRVDDEQLDAILGELKRIGDAKRDISDDDLRALLSGRSLHGGP